LRDLTTAPESLFWYWVAERHRIYLKRQAGHPKPWTDDPILQSYKFTNPFRENDTGTVWLRENFLTPHRWDDPALLAFNCGWFRMFNWWGTGERLGWQDDWNPQAVIEMLTAALDEGEQVFTGAHIVYSRPGLPKIDAIVDVCTDLWNLRETLAVTARTSNRLEEVFNVLRTVDSIGGFMAYEIVTDYRHTRLLEDASDIMTWANPGPGAKRGLQRLRMASKPDAKAIDSMRHLLRHGIELETDFIHPVSSGEPLQFPHFEMRDIEHSLCEFDKYCRVKFNEGTPRAKYNGGA
jgi:hypothetical protein